MIRAAIFVVDDDDDVVLVVAGMMRKMGHIVTVETNGPRALAILIGPEQFDVTFLDLLMPDITGGEIYTALLTAAPARIRRLCFLTGASHLVPTWLRQTGLPVLDKPASREQFQSAIENFAVLDCSRGPMPNHKSGPELAELIDDDEDDDEDDTGVFSATLREHKADSGSGDTVVIAAVKYVHGKNAKLAKRVRALETWRDRIVWIAIGMSLAGGTATAAIWKLIEHAVSK